MPARALHPRARALLLFGLGLLGCEEAPGASPDAGAPALLDAASPLSPITGSDASTARDGSTGIVLPSDGGAPQAPPDAGTTPGSAVGGDAGSAAGAGVGTLPAANDVKRAGPFTPVSSAGPAGYVVFQPKELGRDGVKHPIVSWGPGAAENAGMFSTLLNHLASHGFVVISYDGTPQGAELTKAIDWLEAENTRAGSPFHQKLDTTRVAAGGHSAGSIATFKIAKDARLVTTLHISGGTFDPHTDIANLHAPALFICGEPAVDGLLVGDVARANCDIDFENAEVPVFYGVTKGASHMTPTEIGDAALRTLQLGAMTSWLRWKLAGEASQAASFAGASCGLCSDPGWTVKQRGL